MRSIFFIIALVLIAGCAHLSTAPSPDSIDGTWKGVYDSGGANGLPPLHFIFKFRGDGKSITGKACDTTTKPDEWVQLKNLKREGNHISFISTPSPAPGTGQLTFRYEGIKEGDIINLTFKTEVNGQIAGEPQSFTIKREK